MLVFILGKLEFCIVYVGRGDIYGVGTDAVTYCISAHCVCNYGVVVSVACCCKFDVIRRIFDSARFVADL